METPIPSMELIKSSLERTMVAINDLDKNTSFLSESLSLYDSQHKQLLQDQAKLHQERADLEQRIVHNSNLLKENKEYLTQINEKLLTIEASDRKLTEQRDYLEAKNRELLSATNTLKRLRSDIDTEKEDLKTKEASLNIRLKDIVEKEGLLHKQSVIDRERKIQLDIREAQIDKETKRIQQLTQQFNV